MTLDIERSLDLCTYCPRLCSHACPVSSVSGRESLTPQAKMSQFSQHRRGLVLFAANTAEDVAEDPADHQAVQPVFGCTGCEACTQACHMEVSPAQVLIAARASAAQADATPASLLDLRARHKRRAITAARSLAEDATTARALGTAAQVHFMPTCLPRGTEAQGPVREATALLRVVDRLRAVRNDAPTVELARLETGCAGYPLYAAGQLESFRLYAESFAEQAAGIQTLALSCSACTWLLRTQYRTHGVPLLPRVLHVSELLAPYAADLPVTAPLPSVTYHDPCHLGRRLGCGEAPRQLLARMAGLVQELPDANEPHGAACCGAGGMLPVSLPGVATELGQARLADRGEPTTALISGCAGCAHHLRRSAAASTETPAGHDVLDLIDLLDQTTTPR